jgi:23S rRNA (uracil1939-C5)-methyltransferase
VLHPDLDRLRAELAGRLDGVESLELRMGVRTGERLVVLHGASRLPRNLDASRVEAAIALERDGRMMPIRGFPAIHEHVLDRRFQVSAPSFFQVNTDGAECLATIVRDLAAEAPPDAALDLYAGVGLFSACALSSAARVVGVEIEPSAAQDFRRNVTAFTGVTLRAEPVADVLWDLAEGRQVFDLAVINPPRAGMGPSIVRALASLTIRRLIVVSCDPGSLGRDVGALLRAGYVLREATPVDQFPGTPHVETVAVLER